MDMAYLSVGATFFAVVALASTSTLAADCGADADEANAKCYPTLQAAVDAALAADLPLVLPHGTYRITAPLVIDYSRHADTGFELPFIPRLSHLALLQSSPGQELPHFVRTLLSKKQTQPIPTSFLTRIFVPTKIVHHLWPSPGRN